jgi:hypothetical protein
MGAHMVITQTITYVVPKRSTATALPIGPLSEWSFGYCPPPAPAAPAAPAAPLEESTSDEEDSSEDSEGEESETSSEPAATSSVKCVCGSRKCSGSSISER